MRRIFGKFRYRLYQMSVIFKMYFFKLLFLGYNNKLKDVFFVSERGNDARDNGLWFYKFVKENYPNQKIKFLITKDSPDFKKIDEKDVIFYNSISHYKYLLYSGYLISTHIMGFTPNTSICMRLHAHKLLPIKGKITFLQHGITKDYSKLFEYSYTRMNLFCCGADKEYDYIKKNNHYPDSVIKNIGFCRFDGLIDESEKHNAILIMPTWRHFHNSMTREEFSKCKFFKEYQAILNDAKIINYIETNNVTLYFYVHHETQKFVDLFSTTSKNIIICKKEKYDVQNLLLISKLLITDYSSVYFDFAYMKKPMLFFHFDYEDYRKIRPEGYFDYVRDGFGQVVRDRNELINLIIENDGLSDFYLKRIESFFGKKDCNNCLRTYEAIIKEGQ